MFELYNMMWIYVDIKKSLCNIMPYVVNIKSYTENIMSSVNRVMLIGHLGADPESRAFPDGTAVCNLRIATTDKWRDRETGDAKEATEWHRVVLFRRLAEIAGQYLQKGAQVYVEGRLRTRKWTDKTGAERYSTEIEAEEMKMLGKRADSSGVSFGTAREPQPVTPPRYVIDDTIPF